MEVQSQPVSTSHLYTTCGDPAPFVFRKIEKRLECKMGRLHEKARKEEMGNSVYECVRERSKIPNTKAA